MAESTASLIQEANRIAALWLLKAAKLAYRRQLTLLRPSVVLEATIEEHYNVALDRRHFIASGAGLFAVGGTPEAAYEAFDRLWVSGSQFEPDQLESEASL